MMKAAFGFNVKQMHLARHWFALPGGWGKLIASKRPDS
jgi:hypothetical protein